MIELIALATEMVAGALVISGLGWLFDGGKGKHR